MGCNQCCTVIGPRGLPGRAGQRGPTGPSAGPRGPTGPPGPTGRAELVAGTVLCSGIVNYDPMLGQLEYGPIANNLFAETDAFVFCKAGVLSQAAPIPLVAVPTDAQLLFFNNNTLSTSALTTLSSTDCNTAYVQSTGTTIGLKTKNRLFQRTTTDQTITTGLIDFTDPSGFRCSGAAMTTIWAATSSAIWTVSVNLDLRSAVSGSTTISILNGVLEQNRTIVNLVANQSTTVSLSWTGLLALGNVLSVQSASSASVTFFASINIIEL